MLGPLGGLHRHRLGVSVAPSHPFPGFGIRSMTVVFGRRSASRTGMNSPVLASLPRGVDDSAPWPGFGTRSTTVVFGRWRASLTGMNCPLPASRPRSDELPRDDPEPLPLAIRNLQPFCAGPFPPSFLNFSAPQAPRLPELGHSLSGVAPIRRQAAICPQIACSQSLRVLRGKCSAAPFQLADCTGGLAGSRPNGLPPVAAALGAPHYNLEPDDAPPRRIGNYKEWHPTGSTQSRAPGVPRRAPLLARGTSP